MDLDSRRHPAINVLNSTLGNDFSGRLSDTFARVPDGPDNFGSSNAGFRL